MKVLTEDQANVLIAFLDSFDLKLTGAWSQVEEGMRQDFGIEDPEIALAEVREALSS